VLHAKLRNRTCQGRDWQGQGQGQGLTSLCQHVKVLKRKSYILQPLEFILQYECITLSTLKTTVSPA